MFTKVEKTLDYLTGESYENQGSFLSGSDTVVIFSDVEIFLDSEEVIKRYEDSYHYWKAMNEGKVERNVTDLREFFNSSYCEYEINEDWESEQMTFKIIRL